MKIRKIKRNKALLPALLFFSFVLTALSVFCLLLPNFKDVGDDRIQFLFYAIGGLGTIIFTFSAFNFGFQLKTPKNAVILCEEGFLELTFAGLGAGYISWSNVKDIKIFTLKKSRFMGISLYETGEVLDDAPRGVRRAIDNNQAAGNPEIILRQSDIGISLGELLDLFKKYTKSYFDAKKEPEQSDMSETQPFDVAAKTRVINIEQIVEQEPKATTEEFEKPTPVEEKSIDDLLAELSQSLKSKPETDKPKDNKVAKDLEELIKILKNK